ncbi:helix-turn-helix domain-containing protein [Pseudodesulfovibrio cashew]|uniref:Helix-turn-helix domain-containing protein n=1 Tax=Pseudodesulfovibrio cashew TaxID=2678688 RepID=A0A6I6JKJ6_9BACT|nr:AraC family transcriptional regulator [Pseudodesulfovibrio cashew]QGY41510.1 helix-turn-helix domain-containing protein [Pseudodesulfovibrio cashew]
MSKNEMDKLNSARMALAKQIYRLTEKDDHFEPGIPGLMLVRYETPTDPMSAIYEPCICLVAQGAKRVQLGDEEYIYDENHLLISSVGLPVIANVTRASKEEPLLSLVLKLDLRMLAQLMVDSNLPASLNKQSGRGMAICEVSEPLLDSFQRLVGLADTPDDIPILSPLIHKEILYRLLRSDLGPRLRQIATGGSHAQQIAHAIGWLKENYTKQLKVEGLAKESGMSVSTFHHHFRATTAMSPLQFQKWLRLHEARRLMLSESQDATTAAMLVGYESPSQFSREYKRQFGAPPLRDIKNLNRTGQTKVVTGAA